MKVGRRIDLYIYWIKILAISQNFIQWGKKLVNSTTIKKRSLTLNFLIATLSFKIRIRRIASFWALVNLWKTRSKFSLKSVRVKHQATQTKKVLYFLRPWLLFVLNCGEIPRRLEVDKTASSNNQLIYLSCVKEFSLINVFFFFLSFTTEFPQSCRLLKKLNDNRNLRNARSLSILM